MDFYDVMTLAVILVVVASSVFFILVVAGLPGKIARQRQHPQADAVAVAGWLSLLTLFTLWPAALVWAYCRPLNVHIADDAGAPELTASRGGGKPS